MLIPVLAGLGKPPVYRFSNAKLTIHPSTLWCLCLRTSYHGETPTPLANHQYDTRCYSQTRVAKLESNDFDNDVPTLQNVPTSPDTRTTHKPRRHSSQHAALLKYLRTHGYANDIPRPKAGTKSLRKTSSDLRFGRAERRTQAWVEYVTKSRRTESLPDQHVREQRLKDMARRISRRLHIYQSMTPNTAFQMRQRRPQTNPHQLSLSKITLYLMQKLEGSDNLRLSTNFSKQTDLNLEGEVPENVLPPFMLTYLEDRGFSVQDVWQWTFVLRTRTMEEAVTRIRHMFDLGKARIPEFLILHVLRRSDARKSSIITDLIRIINGILEEDLSRRKRLVLATPRLQGSVMDGLSKDLLFIRLVRLAHRYCPVDLPRIYDIFIRFIIQVENLDTNRITRMANHLLYTISSPSARVHNYSTQLGHVITAQYDLLKAMATSSPPVTLTRLGFRGLIRTRLASPKSLEERQHVAQLGCSWPPYPTIKDRWDEVRVKEEVDRQKWMTSVGTIINEMEKAGYSLESWEDGAKILSGLDTDDTPTIPTRTFYTANSGIGARSIKRSNAIVWAARVMATRTLSEAWTVFTTFRRTELKEQDVPANRYGIVYKEMFRKLLHTQVANVKEKSEEEPLQQFVAKVESSFLQRVKLSLKNLDKPAYEPPEAPKDSSPEFYASQDTVIRGPFSEIREQIHEPSTHGDSLETILSFDGGDIHFHDSLPNPQRLWSMMIEDGMKPRKDLFILLIGEAKNIEDAVFFLNRFLEYDNRRWKSTIRRTKLNPQKVREVVDVEDALSIWDQPVVNQKPPPQALLAAFVKALTSQYWRISAMFVPHAMYLVSRYAPKHVSAYKHVLQCLSRLPKKSRYPELVELPKHLWSFRLLGRAAPVQLTNYLYRLLQSRDIPLDVEVGHYLLVAAWRKHLIDTQEQPEHTRTRDVHWQNCLTMDEVLRTFDDIIGLPQDLSSQFKENTLSIPDEGESTVVNTMDTDAKHQISFTPPPSVPKTATLHLYIRVLLHTDRSILPILRWVVYYQTFLETKNRRLPIIAARSILEAKGVGYDDPVMVEVEELVREGLPSWGGWATVREVKAYRGDMEGASRD